MTARPLREPCPAQATGGFGVCSVSKRFGTQEALAEVSLWIAPGEIHALVGRNGSGKSTLVKILSGYHRADAGSFVGPDGRDLASPEPLRDQMAFIHQDLALLDSLSVLDNVMLGTPPRLRWGRIDHRRERARARALLSPFGLADEIGTPVGRLGGAEAVLVAIARTMGQASDRAVRLLVLDEPTSSLPRSEIERLFARLRSLREAGVGVLAVTHKLDEVFEIADSVTVLRNGRVALSGPTGKLGPSALLEAMVGGAAPALRPGVRGPHIPVGARGDDRPALRLRGVVDHRLRGVDLEVRAGEVLGVVGLLSSGLGELAEVASLRRRPRRGSAEVAGGDRRGKGAVALAPGDRVRQGVLRGLTVRENLSLNRLGDLARGPCIDRRLERESTRVWLRRLSARPDDPDVPIEHLSGGNQQKVVIGRGLAQGPVVLVAEGPTRGVDVAAKADILAELRRAAQAGIAVLLISHEHEEITDACDRVAVLRDGRVVTELDGEVATDERVAQALL